MQEIRLTDSDSSLVKETQHTVMNHAHAEQTKFKTK